MTGLRAAIFGASGGIGAALGARLALSGRCDRIYLGARNLPVAKYSGAAPFTFDLTDELSIAEASAKIGEDGPLDLVVVATGMLHREDLPMPEKSWRAINADAMAAQFAINTIGPALIAKHMLPLLRRDARSVFAALSARVGSIGDNRLGGWHSYRASKAALNMLVRNFAIELETRNPEALAVAIHPGTVDTALSAPFQRGVPKGQLFTPDHSAAQILDVIDRLTAADSGGLFAWNGERLAY